MSSRPRLSFLRFLLMIAPAPMVLWGIGWFAVGFKDPFVYRHWAFFAAYVSGLLVSLISLIGILIGLFQKNIKMPLLSLILAFWPFGVFLSLIIYPIFPYGLFLFAYGILFLILLCPWYLMLWRGKGPSH